MSQLHARRALLRTRWSAIGAAVAVTLGAGGLSMAQAAIDTGDRPVTISIAAERILDTRTDLGLSGRFADGAPRDLQVTGSVPTASGGSKTVVPADAVGVLVNVTVVTPTHEGFLSLRPQGATGDPTTSTVNFVAGAIEPNGATVDLNDGQIQIWVETASNTGTADVLIDVVGYTIDHTHDDRYYTESEVDAAVAAAVAPKADSADVPVVLYASVEDVGGIYENIVSPGVSAVRDSTGIYTVTFPRDVSNCTVSASDTIFDTTRDVSPDQTFGAANEVVVHVTNSASTLEDSYFEIQVFCVPSIVGPASTPLDADGGSKQS
jgi:hypothetical protein